MTIFKHLKNIFLGRSRNIKDSKIFHKISLIAFFAWIGLGADGISSSCYGPEEAFLALGNNAHLSIFVAIASVFTILIISASYSQIVELFPTGGGGYLVASKLLSPTVGMVSGCALLIDYVLTITISIASGADAIFSFLPLELYRYRLVFAVLAVLAMVLLNMRGVKESIFPLIPIFLTFIATHVFIIIYAFFNHLPNLPSVAADTVAQTRSTISTVGFFGMLFLIMRAYSLGAGTYTGIEAVSNGIPVLREPKVETAKKTMRYMALSLAFIVLGLIVSYLLYNVRSSPGKTLNAVLFESVTQSWKYGYIFVLVTLISEATLLFIASQAGFLDGPRVLANMAVDRWFPTRFATLSDRFVIQNGILIMGGLSILLMFFSRGSVRFLVILYSINVFITFVLSQLGMVRHWWQVRKEVKKWRGKITINGIGLVLCFAILLSMIVLKFFEGGWITLLITAMLVILAVLVKRHYYKTAKLLHRLNSLVAVAEAASDEPETVKSIQKPDPSAKTAVLLVNGFNGIGLHTLFGVIRLFGSAFKNFVFVQIGVVDVGNFKGVNEVEQLEAQIKGETERYVKFISKQGFFAESITALAVDAVEEIDKLAPQIQKRFPNAVFFGGQLIFPKDSFILRLLHNHTVFILQRKLYRQGLPFVILPIRV